MDNWKWSVDNEDGCSVMLIEAPFGSMCMYIEEAMSTVELQSCIPDIVNEMYVMLGGYNERSYKQPLTHNQN